MLAFSQWTPSSTTIISTAYPNDTSLKDSSCAKSSRIASTGSALANPADANHPEALAFSQTISDSVLVTMFEETMNNSRIIVLPQTRDSLLRGLELYKARGDKQYRLTDCISMSAMRERNIREVLTHDHHFQQEGFLLLLQS